MPLIMVYTLEGKTQEQKNKWIEELTRVTLEVTGLTDPSRCTVIIQEVPKQHWAKGGVTYADRAQDQQS